MNWWQPAAEAPPALAHATAPPARVGRGFALALLCHVVLLGGVYLVLQLHLHRAPAPPAAPVVALVIEKPPPTPPAPKPAPKPAPPANSPPTPPAKPAPALKPAAAPAPHLTAARPLASDPAPVYPGLASRHGQQGWLLLDVHVTAAGLPDMATVAESSGSAAVDEQARVTVLRRWRFQPALLNGMAVQATYPLWISFDLRH